MAQKAPENEKQLNELVNEALQNGGLLKFVCKTDGGETADKNPYLYVEVGNSIDSDEPEIFLNADLSRSLLQTISRKFYGTDDSDDEPQGEPITEAQSRQLSGSRAEILEMLDYGILDTKNFGDADLIIAHGTGKVYRLTADLSGEVWEIVRLRETTADGQNND